MAILGASVVNGKLEADELQVIGAEGALAVNIKGNTKIDGDLEVNGDVTYIGRKDLRVEDKTIEVGYVKEGTAPTSASLDGAGIIVGNSGSAESFALIEYDHSKETIKFGKDLEANVKGEAEHAASASKVDHKLVIKGDGINEVIFDGSEEKTASLNLAGSEYAASVSASIATEIERAKAEEAKKVDKRIEGTNGTAEIFNEADGGGAHFINKDGSEAFVGVNDGGKNGMVAQIYADEKDASGNWVGSRINVYNKGIFYQSKEDTAAGKAKDAAELEIATVGDVAAEKARAEAAEQANATAIATEKSRAEGKESELNTAIGNEATIARAAESELSDAISAEAERATGVETELENDLTAEVERATAAEEANATAIATETSRSKAAELVLSASIAAAMTGSSAELATYSASVAPTIVKVQQTSGSWDSAATWTGNVSGSYHNASWDSAAEWAGAHSASVAVLEASESVWNSRLDVLETASASLVATASNHETRISGLEAETASYMKLDGSNSNIKDVLNFHDNAAKISYNATAKEFEFIFA